MVVIPLETESERSEKYSGEEGGVNSDIDNEINPPKKDPLPPEELPF